MIESLRRASAFVFYTLGTATIVLIVLAVQGIAPNVTQFLNVLDLPLLFSGMLLAGTSLGESLMRGKLSPALLAAIFLPIVLLFGFFVYLNFVLPPPEVIGV